MIRIHVDTRGFDRWLGAHRRQLPFATSTAINETLKIAQVEQRAQNRIAFKVRNPRFIEQAVKIKPFATKSRLFGIIQIDPPGGQARASILTQHEKGGTKTPAGRSLWIPEPRGATPARKITKSTGGVAKGSGWRPRELELKPHGASGRVWQGRDGTFLIRTGRGKGIVLQRTGSGRRGMVSSLRTRRTRWAGRRSSLRVLYALTPDGKLAPRLHWEEIVVGSIMENWRPEMVKALTHALQTAR